MVFHSRFNPSRFSPEASRGRPKLAFVPFGFGVRVKTFSTHYETGANALFILRHQICIGYKYSHYETRSGLCSILREFEVVPANDESRKVGPKFGFVTKPEREISIKLRKREK